MKFRDLTADDIEIRISQANPNWGVQLLFYKTARTDMEILDETVGVENWQNRFYECKGNLYCSLGININYSRPEKEPQWIWKDDCGSESNMEKEKGEASDARKRAGFAWGIGRELYTAPKYIVFKKDEVTWKDGKCKDTFTVTAFKVEYGKIAGFQIVDNKTKKGIKWGNV